MTTCTAHDAHFAAAPVSRDVIEAVVAAIVYILLLPGAALVMSVLG